MCMYIYLYMYIYICIVFDPAPLLLFNLHHGVGTKVHFGFVPE